MKRAVGDDEVLGAIIRVERWSKIVVWIGWRAEDVCGRLGGFGVYCKLLINVDR